MKIGRHSINKKANHQAVTALSMLLSIATSQSVLAQGLANPSADEDSLLPPEVVPLDPQAANSLSAAQAAKRQVQTGSDSVTPGLVNTPGSNMVSAKDMRQNAFNALYGQGQLPQDGSQWRAGQMTLNNQPGQNANNAPPYSTGYEPQQLADSQPAQTQTLTGGTKNQPQRHDIRRGGFTNTASAVAAFGTGALLGGALYHQSNPLMGLGMFGLTMTGFGVRNAFRF